MLSNCFKEEQICFKAVSYTIEGRLLVNVLFSLTKLWEDRIYGWEHAFCFKTLKIIAIHF